VIGFLKTHCCKRWLRGYGIKLVSGPFALGKGATLIMEEGVSISTAQMEFRLLMVGAMTYMRSSVELLNVRNIGRFCSIGNGAVIGQDKAAHPLGWVSSHPFQHAAPQLVYEEQLSAVEIGHDVWIGRDSMIMEGVTIGTGAVIACRALVTRDVPAYAIVAGVPARIIRYRHSPEVIADLLASEWWDGSVADLLRRPLNKPEAFIQQCRREPVASAAYRRVSVSRSGWSELAAEHHKESR